MRTRIELNAWSRKKIPDPVITVHQLEVGGQRVFARTYKVTRDRGPRPLGGDDVPVIVLVHGIGVSARYFIPLANALADFADVLMLDMPGFSTLPAPEEALGLEGFADVLTQLIRLLDITDPVILGHSMGSQVVVEALAAHPDLAGRALLLGPPVNAAERSLWQVGGRFVQSSVLEPFRVGLVAIPAYLMCGMQWFAEVLPAMLTYPIEERISKVEAMTVLVRGEHDFVAPREWIEQLATACAGPTETYEVRSAAHSVMYRHHDVIAHRLVRLASKPSALGGSRVRLDDLEASARKLGVDLDRFDDPYDLIDEVLPFDDEVRGETLPTKARRHLIANPVGALAGALPPLVTAMREGATASLRSPQWRSVATRDYLHSVRQEMRGVREAASESVRSLTREIAADSDGGCEAARPVYLLPGMNETWRVYGPLSRRLASSGVDVRPVRVMGRSLAPIDALAARVEAVLDHDDARDAVLVCHSKGGLVAKAVLLGPQGWRVRRVIALGTPWSGSVLTGLVPFSRAIGQLRPGRGEIARLAEHPEVNDRIWTVSAAFDEQVPDGTTLEGARNLHVAQVGHNRLVDGPESMSMIERLLREDAESMSSST